MSVTGVEIEPDGNGLSFQSIGAFKSQSGTAFMKAPGTAFHAILLDAQAGGSSLPSSAQSRPAASAQTAEPFDEQKFSGGPADSLAGSAPGKASDSSSCPVVKNASVMAARGSSVEFLDRQTATSTAKSLSTSLSPLNVARQQGNVSDLLQVSAEQIDPTGSLSSVSRNQRSHGAGMGQQEERNKHTEESTPGFLSISPVPSTANATSVPVRIQAEITVQQNSQEDTSPALTSSLNSMLKGVGDQRSEGQSANRLWSTVSFKNDVPAQQNHVESPENKPALPTAQTLPGDLAQSQSSTLPSFPSSKSPAPETSMASVALNPLALNSVSSHSDLVSAVDSVQKGSAPSVDTFDKRAPEVAKSIEPTTAANSPSVKTHGTPVSVVNESGHSSLSDSIGADEPNSAKQAGLSFSPVVSQGSQNQTTPANLSGGKSAPTFMASGAMPSSASVVTQPIAEISTPSPQQFPAPADVPLTPQLPAAMKSGSIRAGKPAAITRNSNPFNANPIGVAVHAASPGVGSPLVEPNRQAGDPLLNPSIDNKTFGAGNSSGSAAAPTTANQTFEALDGATKDPSTNWVHVGTQRAEAGFQDPTLGWIAVRANQSQSGVHAVVLPATAEATQSLGSQMAGLSAHLAEGHSPVTSLSLGEGESREAGTAAGQGFNHGSGHDREEQSARGSQAGLSSGNSVSPLRASETLSSPGALTVPGQSESKYISVMA